MRELLLRAVQFDVFLRRRFELRAVKHDQQLVSPYFPQPAYRCAGGRKQRLNLSMLIDWSSTKRPENTGIWVRVTLTTGEVLYGVLPNNLLKALRDPFQIRRYHQKRSIPRAEVRTLEVLGVIAPPR